MEYNNVLIPNQKLLKPNKRIKTKIASITYRAIGHYIPKFVKDSVVLISCYFLFCILNELVCHVKLNQYKGEQNGLPLSQDLNYFVYYVPTTSRKQVNGLVIAYQNWRPKLTKPRTTKITNEALPRCNLTMAHCIPKWVNYQAYSYHHLSSFHFKLGLTSTQLGQ